MPASNQLNIKPMYNNICFNYAKKGNENKKKFNYFKLFFIFHFTFVRINKKKALF